MDSLEIGKLYTCPKYHLFVFPTIEAAIQAARRNVGSACSGVSYSESEAKFFVDWWSVRVECCVSYIPVRMPLMVVEVGDKHDDWYNYRQLRVVSPGGESVKLGWINMDGRIKLKEMKG